MIHISNPYLASAPAVYAPNRSWGLTTNPPITIAGGTTAPSSPSVLVILPPAYQRVNFERVLDIARSAFQQPLFDLDDLSLRFAWVADNELLDPQPSSMPQRPPNTGSLVTSFSQLPKDSAAHAVGHHISTHTATNHVVTSNVSYNSGHHASHQVQQHDSSRAVQPPSINLVASDMHHVVLSNISPATSDELLLQLVQPFQMALAGVTLTPPRPLAKMPTQLARAAAFGFHKVSLAELCYQWIVRGDAVVSRLAIPGHAVSVRLYHPSGSQIHPESMPGYFTPSPSPLPSASGLPNGSQVVAVSQHIRDTVQHLQVPSPPPPRAPLPTQFYSTGAYRSHVEASYKWIEEQESAKEGSSTTPDIHSDGCSAASQAQQVLAAFQIPAAVTNAVMPTTQQQQSVPAPPSIVSSPTNSPAPPATSQVTSPSSAMESISTEVPSRAPSETLTPLMPINDASLLSLISLLSSKPTSTELTSKQRSLAPPFKSPKNASSLALQSPLTSTPTKTAPSPPKQVNAPAPSAKSPAVESAVLMAEPSSEEPEETEKPIESRSSSPGITPTKPLKSPPQRFTSPLPSPPPAAPSKAASQPSSPPILPARPPSPPPKSDQSPEPDHKDPPVSSQPSLPPSSFSVSILGINPKATVSQVLGVFIDPIRDQFGPVHIQQLGVWRPKLQDLPARGVRFVFKCESVARQYMDQVTVWNKVGALSEVRANGWELRFRVEQA